MEKTEAEFLWTVTLRFAEYLEVLQHQYNIVIFRDPKSFNSSIENMIKNAVEEYNKSQMKLGDIAEEFDDEVDLVKNINEIIRSWNDSINLLWVTNIHAKLEEYKNKKYVKEIKFLVHKDSVDFFKDRYVFWESYVACLEPVWTPREDDPELLDEVLYHEEQFLIEKLNEKDFVL